MVFIWATIAVLCAVTWILAFYREDKYERESLGMIALAALCGVAFFFVASLIEKFALQWYVFKGVSFQARAAMMLLMVGPVEELCKFAPVRLFIYPRRAFNEPMDGIVYGAAAAAGFALIENLLFMQESPNIILTRGPGAPLLHILFAGFWGSALGWAKGMEDRKAARWLVLIGLVLASLTHGAYDLITLSVHRELTPNHARIAMLTLIVVSFAALRWQMVRAAAASPFRKKPTRAE